MEDLPVFSKLFPVVRGHGDEGILPLSAALQGLDEAAEDGVRPGNVQAVHLPGFPLLRLRQHHRRVVVDLQIRRPQLLRQWTRYLRKLGHQLLAEDVGSMRRKDVDPDEFRTAVEGCEMSFRLAAAAQVGEAIEALGVAEALLQPVVGAIGSGPETLFSQGLGQGQQLF